MFFTTVRREAALNAAKLRGRSWWGIEMGDRGLDLWHTGRGWGWKDRLLYLRDVSLNIRAVSAYDLSEYAMRRNLAIMKKWRPRFLYVYPSALFHFTLYLKEQGVDPREFAPEVVFCSAENLFDVQRSLFKAFYGANVVNEYGSHDAGLIAFECPAGKLHLNQEQVYVEIVPKGEGCGKLIITDLENFGQPFIRYEIGDYGELSSGKCTCGRGLAVLGRVLGRASEMLRSTTGASVPGLVLTGLFREIPGIREFQAIQEKIDLLQVRIIKNDCFQPESQKTIERSLKRYLGHDMKFAFEFPETLERRPSGKCSWFISRLSEQWQESA
jgi:phenylacetate-CoA ligase